MTVFYSLISSKNPGWYQSLCKVLKDLGHEHKAWEKSNPSNISGYLLYWPGFVSEHFLNGYPISAQQELEVLPFLLNCPWPVILYGVYSTNVTPVARNIEALLNLAPQPKWATQDFNTLKAQSRNAYRSILRQIFQTQKLQSELERVFTEAQQKHTLSFPEFLKPFEVFTEELSNIQTLQNLIHQQITQTLPNISDLFWNDSRKPGLISQIQTFLDATTESSSGEPS